MGSNSLRLGHAVVQPVGQFLPRGLRATPSAESQAFAAELKSFAVTNWKAFKQAIADDNVDDSVVSQKGHRRMLAYMQAWGEYSRVFNGWQVGESKGDADRMLQHHHCLSGHFCNNCDNTSTKRAVRAIVKLIFRVMPGRPVKGDMDEADALRTLVLLDFNTRRFEEGSADRIFDAASLHPSR